MNWIYTEGFNDQVMGFIMKIQGWKDDGKLDFVKCFEGLEL